MGGLTAQDAAANGHNERCWNTFARDIGDGDTEAFVVDLNIIKVISADLASGHVKSANLKSVNGRRFGR